MGLIDVCIHKSNAAGEIPNLFLTLECSLKSPSIYSPSPVGNHCPDFYHHRLTLPVLEHHKNGIIQYVPGFFLSGWYFWIRPWYCIYQFVLFFNGNRQIRHTSKGPIVHCEHCVPHCKRKNNNNNPAA